ncbi:mucin-binding protein [Levilactobacillus brevis]|uniref:mucin-binding protein n=1 Tax=Levilactobacillus brevis TaxID=1580 RepID=UPI0020CBFCE5|nr:KxYKxGKxW signal peptide domain-containing protein [Levilactobacillus brevis]MCP9615231.1 KxYKxGKxW signal peptide domain-containing protein [Levilactobacillus brevis]
MLRNNLRNNYFGEIKTHYKLYKCGKNWAVMGISLFSLGLGMLVTSQPVSADVTATSTSSSAAKAETTSASSSSAVKAETTSASSSSAAKAETTSVSSSSAAKADTTSASSSSEVNADANSASSSSATKANVTSASSSSAAKSDATSASSSSATKANVTSASSSSAAKSYVASTTTPIKNNKISGIQSQNSISQFNKEETVSGKVTVNKDNFDNYFNQNGSANNNYDKNTGVQTITDGSFQSGNVAFDGAIDVRNNFEIDGAINLGQITSSQGYTGIADGIGFVFYKGDRNQVGGNGGNLGIYGVTDAFGWKVDTWFNDSKFTNSTQILKGDYDDGHTNPYGAFITTDDTGYGTIDQQSAQNLVSSIEDSKFHDVKFIYTASTKEFKIILTTPNGNVNFSKTFDYDTNSPAYYFTIASSTGALPTHQAFKIDSMTYSPIQKAIINYIDDTTGKTIASDSVTGNSGEIINYSTGNKILNFQKQGYELVSDGFSESDTYDDDDTVDQNFTVHLKHRLTPVKPTDPQTPGTPINPDEPDGPKWPTSTNYDKTVNETISYVDQNGHVVAKQHTDSVNFTRTVVVDNVTGEVITSGAGTTAWTATNGDTTFDAVVSPVVPGSVADKAQTAAVTDLNADSADVNETVTYTKVGSLVPSSSDGNFPETPTVVYPNDPSDATKVTPAGVPTVPGYTAHDPEGHVLTPGSSYQPSDPTKDTTITYTADQQKGSVSYVDDTTGKTLKTDSISGTTGSKSSYSTSGSIADYKKQGYELVTDGYPADLTFDNDDTTDQNFTVHLKHQNIQSTEAKTVTETIHYQGAGNQTPADNTAQVTFTRQVSTDAVTGEKTYGSWSADQSFAAVTSPVIKGYTPDQAEIGAQTVSGDASDLDFTVVYTKDAPTKPVNPSQPTTPTKPVNPSQPTTPAKPVNPSQPTTPTKPVNPSQPTTPTKPVQAGQAAATNFVDQRLPQTDETDQQHMTLSGLLLLAMSSLLGLFGMTKRQRKE